MVPHRGECRVVPLKSNLPPSRKTVHHFIREGLDHIPTVVKDLAYYHDADLDIVFPFIDVFGKDLLDTEVDDRNAIPPVKMKDFIEAEKTPGGVNLGRVNRSIFRAGESLQLSARRK